MTASLLNASLAIIAERGCACGTQMCLVHYDKWKKENTKSSQEDFYVRPSRNTPDDPRGSGGNRADTAVPSDRRGHGHQPAEPVRKSAGKKRR